MENIFQGWWTPYLMGQYEQRAKDADEDQGGGAALRMRWI